MTDFLQTAGYVLACLLIPIVWGWLVHAAYERFLRPPRGDEDSTYVDYQI